MDQDHITAAHVAIGQHVNILIVEGGQAGLAAGCCLHRLNRDTARSESCPAHKLTAEQIIAYDNQYDPQPFHTDEVAAKNAFSLGLLLVAGIPLV